MKVDGKNIRTIWLDKNEKTVKIIDQRKLPHEFVIVDLKTVDDVITAIKDMYVRGAPLIGATGAYGLYLAVLNAPDMQIDDNFQKIAVLEKELLNSLNISWRNILIAILDTHRKSDFL